MVGFPADTAADNKYPLGLRASRNSRKSNTKFSLSAELPGFLSVPPDAE